MKTLPTSDLGSPVRGLRVMNVLLDARMSGPALRVLRVAVALRRLGVDTTIVVPRGHTTYAERVRAAGLPCVQVPLLRLRRSANPGVHLLWTWRFATGLAALRDAIRAGRAQVVHVNGLMQFQAALAARWAGARLLWHLNDTLTPAPLRRLFRPILRRMPHALALAARAVRPHYLDGEPAACPVHVLYPPVDANEFNPATAGAGFRAALGIPADRLVVSTALSVHPLKGLHHLLQAAARVCRADPRVCFLVGGQRLATASAYWDRLQREREALGLADRVRFLGHVDDMPAFLRATDIFVLPSLSEACPTAVMEAQAMERPVVTTDVGGAREIVRDGETGHIVPPADPEALARRVLELAGDARRREDFGRKGRSHIIALAGLDRVALAHAAAYRDALAPMPSDIRSGAWRPDLECACDSA